MDSFKTTINKKKKKYTTLSYLERDIVDRLLKIDGLDFDSNFKVGPYFVDIAFPKHKVGLEIDGQEYHSTEAQITKDQFRQEYLEQVKGWKIERIPGWFCYRHPEITMAKVLRHVPEVKDHPIYLDGCEKAKQWHVRDLLNRGEKEKAIDILYQRR